MREVDPQRSRIVLIGTPAYQDPELGDRPQVTANVTDLAAVLTDPQLGGFPAEHVQIAPAQADAAQIGDLLATAAAQADDRCWSTTPGTACSAAAASCT